MSVKPEYSYPKKIVIGTRGSPLALAQTHMVRELMDNIGQDVRVEVRVILTSGDWKPEDGEVRLSALEGGKAQFAKEIEEAMLEGGIDIAVHSMKDMETVLPDGLVIPFMLPREDARDAFLSSKFETINDLPAGAIVGTTSARRQAFLLHKRPDLKIVPFRGNVQTRIDKLRNGQVDATFLACAGLNRLGLSHEITSVMDMDDMLPAVGQGAVGIEIRTKDMSKLSFLSQFSCSDTYRCVEAERSVLRALGGSCHTSVGVHAVLDGMQMRLRVQVVSPDGSALWGDDVSEVITSDIDARILGETMGSRLKSDIPHGILV